MKTTLLAIESSCDDTSAAVLQDGYILSNIIASQKVHEAYGGVIPELASRAHQQNIVPVVAQALREANIKMNEINAIAFTRGPGLLGSLLVGTSFAKGLSLANKIPLIEVDHLDAHVLSHFIIQRDREHTVPKFPFLCLLVSGGNSQIILVKNPLEMEIIGQTIDDAAGEAFDKCAKTMGLPYPGGPHVDRLAKEGNPMAFKFAKPRLQNYQYSFSGLKTSFLYFLRDQIKTNSHFIEENLNDLCASLQNTIVEILLDKVELAAKNLKIKQIALAGGVSANSALRKELLKRGEKFKWDCFIPALEYTTDNAAMVAISGYFKYQSQQFTTLECVPYARVQTQENSI